MRIVGGDHRQRPWGDAALEERSRFLRMAKDMIMGIVGGEPPPTSLGRCSPGGKVSIPKDGQRHNQGYSRRRTATDVREAMQTWRKGRYS